MKKCKCPCCGFYTIEAEGDIIVEICEVCFWQYDIVAHKNPNISIGPNKVSLNKAKENFKKYKISANRFLGKNLTREPLPEEYPDNNEEV